MRVRERSPQAGLQIRFHPDGGADGAGQKVAHAGHQCIDVDGTGHQPLPARKRQQLLGQLGAALGGAHGIAHEPVLTLAFDPMREQIEIADHGGEQVVEVVRDAAGELTDGFHLLRLQQDRLGALALADLRHQAVVGLGQLAGALLHPALEAGGKLAHARFGALALLQEGVRLALAAARPLGRLGRAQQRHRPQRTFEHRHVAEQIDQMRGVNGTAIATQRQQDERKIRPRRLAGDPACQWSAVDVQKPFLGHHRRRGALKLVQQLHEMLGRPRLEAPARKRSANHIRVAPVRREDEDRVRRGISVLAEHCSGSQAAVMAAP
jgi:hypothetical protein